MPNRGFISNLSNDFRLLIGLFLIVLSIGYFTGISFVQITSKVTPEGIVENYNGNESNEDSDEMKFKKSDYEILNILHTHFLSLSVIFLILGILVYGCTACTNSIQKFLMLEPLVSVLVTFSGIYFIWLGYEFMTYIVMISGALMTASYIGSIILISYNLFLHRS
ncbi:MAG: hypothetical protein ACI9FN_002946 [Saprospiraceae bacterium]|jgi:hypothetical protein